MDTWNIGTQVWLRRICYDRLPTLKTLGVFVLSAFWHGFYPGYYFTFVIAAFGVYAGRGVRFTFICFLSNLFNLILYITDQKEDKTVFPNEPNFENFLFDYHLDGHCAFFEHGCCAV